MIGTLRIVGLGPGDPELVTVKAVRILGAATTIVHFAKRGAAGHARTIAGHYVHADVEELRLEYPFTTELAVDDPAYRRGIDAFHDAASCEVASRLEAGRDVVLLCEGDPFFYGSSMHLFDRIAARGLPVEIVPGIPAMSGAWSETGLPIAHGDDVLKVIPGTLDAASLTEALAGAQAAVVMKIGRNLARVRAALEAAGALDRAIYVERATQEGAHSMPLAARDAALPAPYFSLILVPGRRHAR